MAAAGSEIVSQAQKRRRIGQHSTDLMTYTNRSFISSNNNIDEVINRAEKKTQPLQVIAFCRNVRRFLLCIAHTSQKPQFPIG